MLYEVITGIGDSLIYLVDRYPENDYGHTIYDVDFKPLPGFERNNFV